jgi:hypothetical protein
MRVLEKNGTLIFSSHNIKHFHYIPLLPRTGGFLNFRAKKRLIQNKLNAFYEKKYLAVGDGGGGGGG